MHEDVRIAKTQKAINAAFQTLLELQSFRKITVRDICEEALVSRATFYAHFDDKYDLLKNWLQHFKPHNYKKNDGYEKKEALINEFIHKNKAVIRGLFNGADDETLGILSAFALSHLGMAGGQDPQDPKQIVLANFYAGGMLNYVQWQINHKFPPEVAPMNLHLYQIMLTFRNWDEGGTVSHE